MLPGDVVDDRFEIDQLAGGGGMGQVFRAGGRHTGDPVAVKALLGESGVHAVRFVQEARALSDLSHPGIVRHVSHGVAASGQPYLVMEWLEGEDLSKRLD